jgi:D-3-phosphoglycerate dehydrogenase
MCTSWGRASLDKSGSACSDLATSARASRRSAAFGGRRRLEPELTARRRAGVGLVSKTELFETADVVTIHLVLGERTRGLVRKEDLARMKAGAVLVNTSRGPIIVEPDLLEVLKAGKIHAALDVYEREPLPADHPLRKMDNVTLSPHLGYVHDDNYRIFYGDTVENVAAWMAGKPLRVINP